MISLMRPRVPLKTAVGIALCAIALVEAANLPSLARGRATAPTAMPINAGPGAFVFRLERSYRERLLFEGKINGDDRLAFALTDRSATAPVVLWHERGEFQASLVGATAVVSGVLYFVTWEYSHGFFGTLSRTTLWISNGTPDGTMAVTTLPCLDVDLTAAAGLLFFCCGGVWRSDGTAAGTVQLQTVNAITQVFNLAATERGISFESASGAVMEVCWSDGTTQATKALASFPYDYNEGFLTVLGERAVFGVGQHDLWISDGTPAGTTRFAMSPDPLPGVLGSVSVVDNRAFFTSIGEVPGRGQRGTLWVTDGTASGTLRVADFPCRESYDCSLLGIAGVGGRLLFSAFDEHTGYELWRTVGKRARSHLLVDLRPGPDSSAPEDLIPVNSRLFFMVHSDVFNQDDDQTS